MFFSFLSLANLPLALATALGFLSSLLSVPAAMVFLSERPARIVTISAAAGFGGIVMMLWPSLTGPDAKFQTVIGVLAGVATAVLSVAAKLQIKELTKSESPGSIAFYFAAFCTLAGLATLPFGWSPTDAASFYYLSGAGIVGGLAHIAMVEAIQRAPIATLAPFEYTAMLWAFVFDVTIFALVPSAWELCGALVIVIAAILVAARSRL